MERKVKWGKEKKNWQEFRGKSSNSRKNKLILIIVHYINYIKNNIVEFNPKPKTLKKIEKFVPKKSETSSIYLIHKEKGRTFFAACINHKEKKENFFEITKKYEKIGKLNFFYLFT